jgi:hypothetical protein
LVCEKSPALAPVMVMAVFESERAVVPLLLSVTV